MISTDRKVEIDACVDNVHKRAEEYQLSHATFACGSLLREAVKVEKGKCIDELKNEIYASTKGNSSMHCSIEERLNCIEQRYKLRRIIVEYIEREIYARALTDGDNYLILLPRSLSANCVLNNGKYDSEAIHKLRKTMAHELGHIMLHHNDLEDDNHIHRGTLNLTKDQDEEAVHFAEKLLILRDMRIQALSKI